MDIGFSRFPKVAGSGIIFRWPTHRSDSGACGTRTCSPAFAPNPRCAVSSVIRRRASSRSHGAQKNGLRVLRANSFGLVRPAYTAGSRSAVRRHAHLPGDRGPAGAMPQLRQGEARAARFPGGQPALYETLCPLRGPALSAGDDQGHCGGAEARLGYGQDVREAVHASPARPRGQAGAQGDRHRRDLDPHHSYRIVVSDLIRRRPIWFGGEDRSEASMAQFYDWLGPKKSRGIRLAVMDMWKPFRNTTRERAPQAAVLFDKFHIIRHLGEALDKVRKTEYARLSGKGRRFIKGQKYTLLARHENLSLEGKRSLTLLLAANKRLNTAYVLKESFGQLWDYEREGWARRFFENWRASLKWQRLAPYEKFAEMIDRHWDGVAAYCRPENKVSLGFVEGLNNKIRVIQRRAYGLHDQEYLRLKVLTCMLPAL